MFRYKRILVNLNLSESDNKLIKYALQISDMANSEKIYFLYTEKKMDVPDDLLKEYPQLTESAADYAREHIKRSIENITGENIQTEINIIIQEGQALDELLKQVRINGIDLVITGINHENTQSIDTATKLARKATCSVLVLPESGKLDLTKLAVAVDFSGHSSDALDAALAFTKAAEQKELGLIHVYQVPSGFHKTGKSYEEFSEIMKSHAKKRMTELIEESKKDEVQLTENYILNENTVKAIRDTVHEKGITFIALGARGRGAGAAVMLGSVSEKLIEQTDIPVLAVKQKGTGLNILDAILS